MTLPITPRTPFGARIRAERERAQLTQTELGDALSIPATYVSQLETGREPPTPRLILALAAAFDVDADELYALAHRTPEDIIERIDQAGDLRVIKRVRGVLDESY
jgi:transcriptional regulator with XRE-family HTH domain